MSNLKNSSLSVLVVGTGGREHSIIHHCLKSPYLKKIIAAPGNAGIEDKISCFPISISDLSGLVLLAKNQNIDLVIVGPEVPLCLGLADALATEGIPCYGPKAVGAAFEASKSLTNRFLNKYKIPTGRSRTFTELKPALAYLNEQHLPIVIKADGLAAGKGVIITEDLVEAQSTIQSMLSGDSFGDSGKTVVIEECLSGPEISIMLMVSGRDFVQLPFSQDHKRIGEGDTGKNTGGMGAYAPANLVDTKLREEIHQSIIKPTLEGFIAEGIDYRGTLYIGIMLTSEGPQVLEFNVRFGDPETQVLLPLLKSDPLKVLYQCAMGILEPREVIFHDFYSMVVVLASGGYPDSYSKGDPINIPSIDPFDSTWILHAGTKRSSNGQIITDGGRVLGVTASGRSLNEASKRVYKACKEVSFKNMYYRKDIGHQELI